MTSNTARTAVIGCVLSILFCAAPSGAAGADDRAAQQPSQKKPVKVTIYPILVQAPIFGASIDLPSIGNGGGEAGELSGETDVSLNGAALFGFKIDANRWFAEFDGTWADVSAERKVPFITVDTDNRLYSARGGVRLIGGFAATAGFRRVTSELTATLTIANLNKTISGTAKPTLWDPLIGVDWSRQMGRVDIDASFQGGGFGVGTDKEFEADLHADWEFIRHFVLRGGYSLLYYKMTIGNVNIGQFQRTLVARQTLTGPSFGIGITF